MNGGGAEKQALYFFNELMKKMEALGVKKVIGMYIQSKKNKIVESLYDDLGFTQQSSDPASKIYILNTKDYIVTKTKIKRK